MTRGRKTSRGVTKRVTLMENVTPLRGPEGTNTTGGRRTTRHRSVVTGVRLGQEGRDDRKRDLITTGKDTRPE